MKRPHVLVRWVEPEDWARYETHFAKSKPLIVRLRRELWFFARWWVFFLFPWFLLRLSQLPTIPTLGFLPISFLDSLFLTAVHWMYVTHPGRSGSEISFRNNGISVLLRNGQHGDYYYHHLYGWAVIEREFEGHVLHILLLKVLGRVIALALPDLSVRDQVTQILTDRKVPQVSDLKPSWEAE